MTRYNFSNVCQIAGWLVLAVTGPIPTTARAAEPRTIERETREFKVSVDGKGRGKCKIEITRRDDGTESNFVTIFQLSVCNRNVVDLCPVC